MSRRALLACVVALVAWSAPDLALASDVPPHLSHQGVLTDANGVVVADGLYTLEFEIFDAASAGNLLFSQELGVQVTGGVYNVLLSDGGGPGTLAQAFENPSTYLQITITGVPAGSPITPPETLAPRQKFVSVPYAMVAAATESSRVLVDSFDANDDPEVVLSLPTGFDRFEIELIDVYPVSTSVVEFHLQASTDGGATFHQASNDYSWTVHFARNSYHGHNGVATDSKIQVLQNNPNEMFKNAPGKAFNGRVTVLNVGGGNSYFTVMVEGASYGGNVNEAVIHTGTGLLTSTTDSVDVIRFKVSSGNLGGGRFRVYGIR